MGRGEQVGIWMVMVGFTLSACREAPPRRPAADPGQAAREIDRLASAAIERPAPSDDAVPGEDASLAELAYYWARQRPIADPPSAAIAARLADAIEQHPDLLPRLLYWLPGTPELGERVFQALEAGSKRDEAWKRALRDWVMQHTPRFRPELVAAAKAARFEGGEVKERASIEALGRLDPVAAKDALTPLISGSPELAAVALGVLHGSAKTEIDRGGWWKRLDKMTHDRSQPAFARNEAARALLGRKWTGREAWAMESLGDPTLLRVGRSAQGPTHPVAPGVTKEPTLWIPLLSERVRTTTGAVRNAAVKCLLEFQLARARADALRPLVPWLADPAWANTGGELDRLRLIQSLARVAVPEAQPGLRRIVENESGLALEAAAEALARLHDTAAVPLLRRALPRARLDDQSPGLVKALVALGGFTDADTVRLIELAARAQRFGRDSVEPGLATPAELDADIKVGRALSRAQLATDPIASEVLARAAQLDPAEPAAAEALIDQIVDWPTPAVDRFLVDTIGRGRLWGGLIQAAIRGHARLAAGQREGLVTAAGAGGAVGGLATAILGDQERAARTLAGADDEAKRALLAAARFGKIALPEAAVGGLLVGPNAAAARAYLEALDSPTARTILVQTAPTELAIAGARPTDPGHPSFDAFDRLEAKLRDRMRADPEIVELFALGASGAWVGARERFLTVRGDSTRYEADDAAPKDLAPEVSEALRAPVGSTALDDLPMHDKSTFEGLQFEYVHLRRDGGLRVFMNNPAVERREDAPYVEVLRRFQVLDQTEALPPPVIELEPVTAVSQHKKGRHR